MAQYGAGEAPHRNESPGHLSIAYLLAAVALIGVGLFGITLWLVTQSWLDFAAVLPLVFGAYMLFTRGTGPDRA